MYDVSNRVDQLLGGKGWISGEVSEICGVAGIGKTMMCLNSMIAMLVQDESSQAFWIETVNHEFSVQRASDTAKAFLLSRKDRRQEPQESGKEDLVLEVSFNAVLLLCLVCIDAS